MSLWSLRLLPFGHIKSAHEPLFFPNSHSTTRRYAVSYYLLSAMLHLASEMGDRARLREISREASERQAWLDTHEPTHPLATRSGHPGAFDVLASIATARADKGQAKHRGPSRENGQ